MSRSTIVHWYSHLYPEWESLPYWQQQRNAHRERAYLHQLAVDEAAETLTEARAEAARGGQIALFPESDLLEGCCR